MFKALSPSERGSAQAIECTSLTTGSRTTGNTETRLAANRVEATVARTLTNQIDG